MPTPGSIHDDLLVLRCQAGNGRAFDALVSRWQDPLLNYAHRLTNDWAAAQDIAQETWIVVIRGLVSLRDVARFKPWLFRIASHKCADYWRRSKRATTFARLFREEIQDREKPAALSRNEELANAFSRLPRTAAWFLRSNTSKILPWMRSPKFCPCPKAR